MRDKAEIKEEILFLREQIRKNEGHGRIIRNTIKKYRADLNDRLMEMEAYYPDERGGYLSMECPQCGKEMPYFSDEDGTGYWCTHCEGEHHTAAPAGDSATEEDE